MIRSRLIVKNGSAATSSAATPPRANVAKASSNSWSFLAFTIWIGRPMARAASCNSRDWSGAIRIYERTEDTRGRHHLVQQAKSLRVRQTCQQAYARDVSARSVYAADQVHLDVIAANREDDRNGRSRNFGRKRRRFASGRSEHRHTTLNEIGCQLR